MGKLGVPFPKGKSGNPGGRPKQASELRTKCRQMTEEVLARLKQILHTDTDTFSSQVAAAKLILAYGYGAPQTLLDDDDSDTRVPALTAEETRFLIRSISPEGRLLSAEPHEPEPH